METYIALLRGINVSGKKVIKMALLKSVLEKNDFESVTTYIQSGNIVFKSDEKNTHQIELEIGACIKAAFGFDVPVLVIAATNFQKIINQNPYANQISLAYKLYYFVLLKSKADAKLVRALNKESYPTEEYIITEDCIYLYCKNGYGKARCNNNFFERKLNVAATTRNYKTMMKLVALAYNN